MTPRRWSPDQVTDMIDKVYQRSIPYERHIKVKQELSSTKEELEDFRRYHEEQLDFYLSTQEKLLQYLHKFLPTLEEPFQRNPYTSKWFPPLKDPLQQCARMEKILSATPTSLPSVVRELAPSGTEEELQDLLTQIILTRNLPYGEAD